MAAVHSATTHSQRPINLVGHRFGRLTALARSGTDASGRVVWSCRCDCGATLDVRQNALRKGNTMSCGCMRADMMSERNTRHGMRHHPLYSLWKNMRARCQNPRIEAFRWYGGRGIAVCERWNDFAAFLADMEPRPAGTTLDHRDANGPYSPDNCRWATPKEQALNLRSTILIELDGVVDSMSGWARRLGVGEKTVRRRHRRGERIDRPLYAWAK